MTARPFAWLRRHVWSLLALLAAGLALAQCVAWAAWFADGGVRPSTEVARLPSPDGAWVAVLSELSYPTHPAGTAVQVTVSLAPADDPRASLRVLEADTGRRHDERPRVSWTAPRVLRVVVPNTPYLAVDLRRCRDVQVELRYDPPETPDEAAWWNDEYQEGMPRSGAR